MQIQANRKKEICDTLSVKVDGYLRLQHPVFSQLFSSENKFIKIG